MSKESSASTGGTILDEILAHKVEEVRTRKSRVPEADLRREIDSLTPTRGFVQRLNNSVSAGSSGVIAEVKKASPSKGVIRADFHPAAIARSYESHGASCLSILTEERYFQGHDEFLREVREAVQLPLLRKDFIVDGYQIPESRVIGADCILLIVSALSPQQLVDYYRLAAEIDLDVLIEVHDAEELEMALTLDPGLIGINNRNLKTFETRLDTTIDLIEKIPEEVLVVTESGIHTTADVALMREHGVHAFLVGEAFMRAEDPGRELENLFAA
jgi:indole-3-glycerol phosphate synthase